VQVHLANAAVKIFTRRGNDWTNRFKKIADDAWHINAASAVIDGEVIVPSDDGVSDFWVLQNELRGKSNKLVLYAFDLLYLNGFDVRKAPLFERKALLRMSVHWDKMFIAVAPAPNSRKPSISIWPNYFFIWAGAAVLGVVVTDIVTLP
jgi:ATP-dependent DNA ligase